MVRPVSFSFNEETAVNNAFQNCSQTKEEAAYVERKAIEEFDRYVSLLKCNGVEVVVVQDTPIPFTPDSIFPNNCFSTHCELVNGRNQKVLVIYPMFAPNRRKERQKLVKVLDKMSYDKVIDLTSWESDGKYLEGTGSLILDRDNKIAFACRSPRTNEDVLNKWAEELNYNFFLFDSEDENHVPVYHTNVIMHLGTRYAVVCLESIKDNLQREKLCQLLESKGKQIVPISLDQMHHFAGNMLEVKNDNNEKILVMSQEARLSLNIEQTNLLENDCKIVSPDIHNIENTGGGSARCMIAELF